MHAYDLGLLSWQGFTLEFDRSRKSMSVYATDPDGNGRMYCKGAPEMVLSRCSHALLNNGSKVPITDGLRSAILAQTKEYGTGACCLVVSGLLHGVDVGEGLS